MTDTLQQGSRIGPYDVIGPVGAGGMGEVYRARDQRLQRDVAIKILPSSFAADPDRLQRFEREARILASLDHRHIAGIYGIEEIAGSKALVLEFVDGITLAERIERGALDVHESLTIARQIADAVECAHEQGIIHRDLKPANIKVRSDGTVKVLDFGLARATQPGTEELNVATITAVATKAGTVMGTAAYMSPEQARGRQVDKRTDIWAFGCVLFEMLSGRRAFAADGTTDTLAKVLQREPEWQALPSDIPQPIKQLIARCLHKEPTQRLRDIGDARLAIDDFQSGAGVIDTTAKGPAVARRRLVPVLLVAAFAALVGAALDRGYRALTSGSAAPQFSQFNRLVASAAHETAPVISPDGKWVAYLSNARGPTDVWVKFIGSGEAVNLTEKLGDIGVQSQDIIGGLAVSPDGLQLAFSAGPPDALPGTLATWVMPAPLGGVPRKLAAGQGLKWSPDGKRIAYVLPGGLAGDSIAVADADGQNEQVVLKREGGKHAHWLNWSLDGKFVYFTSSFQNLNTAPIEVARVSSTGGALERVIPTTRRAMFPTADPTGRGLLFAANPDTVETGLWWHDFRSGENHRITSGVGEYGATDLSNDGKRLVAVASSVQQSLQRLVVRFDQAQQMEPLTDGFSGDLDPSWAPDGKRIVFSSSRSGNRNIWSARADLSQPVAVTTGEYLDERPVYSPDGREVAFVSDRGGHRGIWIVRAEGGAPRPVIEAHVLDYLSWSPDGTRIVYSEPGREVPRLAIVDVATGKSTALPERAAASSPSWSPTGDSIAYVETSGGGRGAFLRFVTSDGRNLTVVNDSVTRISNGVAAWSPDGRRLAGIGNPGSRSGYIWIVEPGSPTPFRKLTDLPADVRVRGVSWTPDGSALVIGHVRATGDIVLAERIK